MKRALLTGCALIGLSYEAFSAEMLYRAANDFKAIASPMKLEMTSSSPTGARVFSSLANSGTVVYALELSTPSEFQVQAYVLSESSSKNAFGISINGGAPLTWDLEVSSTYAWKTLPAVYNAKAGALEITLTGIDAYTRIAGLRIVPKALTVNDLLYRAANEYSTMVAPMKLETTASSPTGVRAYTTTGKAGSAKYKFAVAHDTKYQIEAYVLAESATKNSLALAIDGAAAVNWDLDTSAAYAWRTFPAMQSGKSGWIEIEVDGADAYTRVAALRIVKDESSNHLIDVAELNSSSNPPAPPVVILPALDYKLGSLVSVNEGVASTLTVNKVAGTAGGSIPYKISNNATKAVLASGTLTFADSDTSKTISVLAPEDNIVDASMKLEVIVGDRAPLIVSVVDNDHLPALAVTEGALLSVNEGVPASLMINKVAGTDGGSVAYQILNNATKAVISSGSLTFSAADTAKSISVLAPDDDLYNPDMKLEIKVAALDSLIVPVIENDPAPIPLTVSVEGPAALNEGVAANLVIKKVSGNVGGNVAYKIMHANSLSVIASGTVAFSKTDLSKNLPIMIPDDNLYDEKETDIEIVVADNNPLLIPFIDNDKPIIPDVAVNNGVNTNFVKYVSPIDGNAKMTNTMTLDVSSGGFAASLQAAILTATPGTRIIIPDGTYTNQALNFGAKTCPVGKANQPIIIQAATPGGVTLKGASAFRVCGQYIVIQGLVFTGTSSSTPFKIGDTFGAGYMTCDNCAIRNIKIDGYVPVSPDTSTTWIQILSQDGIFKTSEGFEISDSYFNNKVNQGVILYSRGSVNGAKHRYYRNYFSRPIPSGSVANGLEAIRIGDSASSHLSGQAIVEHNLFYKSSGDAEIVSLKTSDNIVRFNTFANSLGAVSIRIGHRNVIEGNYILAAGVAGSGGIRMNGTDNIAVGNHVQDGKSNGAEHMSAIGMLNAEDIPCATAAYCQVVRPFIVGNFLSHNDSGIVVGAVRRTDRVIGPVDGMISRNIVDTTGTSSSAIVNNNPILDVGVSNNEVLGKMGLALSDDEFEKVTSLAVATKANFRMPSAKADLLSLRLSQAELKALGMSDAMRSRVTMENQSIYEVSSPLTNLDVGLYASEYKN